MGSLALSLGDRIYIDANILIYTVERVPPYLAVLDDFWRRVSVDGISVVTSELTVMETLIGPLKSGDTTLETLFRRALFSSPDLKLAPITLPLLERAASIRANLPSLRTPDAIHLATCLEVGCTLLFTNDPAFRRAGLTNTVVLSDLRSP